MIIKITLIILYLLLPSHAYACQWVQGKGEVVADNFTPAEAKIAALRHARHEAIEKGVGVKIGGITLVKDFSAIGDFVKSMSKGYIKEERVIKWEQDKYQPSTKDPPITVLRVFIDACVVPTKARNDKGFFINAKLNKTLFLAGEKAIIEISSNRKAYLNIFNLSADDRLLFYHQPPFMNMPITIQADEKLLFPMKGIVLEMSVPNGHKRATEAFIVIATLDNVSLPIILNGKTDLTLEEFYNVILSLDNNMIEEMLVYSVENPQIH